MSLDTQQHDIHICKTIYTDLYWNRVAQKASPFNIFRVNDKIIESNSTMNKRIQIMSGHPVFKMKTNVIVSCCCGGGGGREYSYFLHMIYNFILKSESENTNIHIVIIIIIDKVNVICAILINDTRVK